MLLCIRACRVDERLLGVRNPSDGECVRAEETDRHKRLLFLALYLIICTCIIYTCTSILDITYGCVVLYVSICRCKHIYYYRSLIYADALFYRVSIIDTITFLWLENPISYICWDQTSVNSKNKNWVKNSTLFQFWPALWIGHVKTWFEMTVSFKNAAIDKSGCICLWTTE